MSFEHRIMKNNYLKQFFTALLLLCGTVAFAEEVTVDGIKYDVVTKAKVATVISGGDYTGDVVVPESFEYNGVTYSVTRIENTAFYHCSGLTTIVIPNSVTSIGDMAFFYCSGLTSIVIPNSVTSIGNYAFSGCSGLTSVELPNSVTSIGDYVFSDCSGLTGVVIPNSVISIGKYMFTYCTSLTAVEIPNSITTIGNFAFSYCYGLTDIVIPNSVTSIGRGAFYECLSLASIELPNSVASIGESAFTKCSGLTNVTIGSGVRYIYGQAFAKCDNLADVYCLATKAPSTDTDAFDGLYPEYMILHVPAEAVNDYKTTAPWSAFGTIKAIEDVEVPVCAAPVISYNNGELLFKCETEGAECVTDIKCDDNDRFYGNKINLSATYSIGVYATLSGYENSETVYATLCWIDNGENDNDNSIISVPATAALITSAGGAVTVSCQLNGEAVAVYTADGVLVGTATIDNGTATIATGLSKGTIAIVKIGEKSVKVVVG